MSTFNASDSWVPAGLKKPVKEAFEAGWFPAKTRTKSGGWWIHSPKKSERFYVPITCNSPDVVGKKLRELITKAYLAESSSFVKDHGGASGEEMKGLTQQIGTIVGSGVRIIPGTDMQMECPVCEVSFESWEAFAAHQAECDAKAAAKAAEEKAREVPEPVAETVKDSTEPAQSGTIGTKEETPVGTENAKPAPKQAPKPQQKKKGGYTWTYVEEPLHRAIYEAIRYNRRWKDETDSKWAKRLAQYMVEERLLDSIAAASDPDMAATLLLEQVRELVGVGDNAADSEEIEQLKKDSEAKDTEIAALTEKVGELRGLMRSLSELANEEADK